MARVLICEPHDDICALLEVVVRRLGHDPVLSMNGEEDGLPVDVAVIEPGEPIGMALARSLRAQGVPVLFTSIYPPDNEALGVGPAAYLVKPFPLYALERALQGALVPVASAAAV